MFFEVALHDPEPPYPLRRFRFVAYRDGRQALEGATPQDWERYRDLCLLESLGGESVDEATSFGALFSSMRLQATGNLPSWLLHKRYSAIRPIQVVTLRDCGVTVRSPESMIAAADTGIVSFLTLLECHASRILTEVLPDLDKYSLSSNVVVLSKEDQRFLVKERARGPVVDSGYVVIQRRGGHCRILLPDSLAVSHWGRIINGYFRPGAAVMARKPRLRSNNSHRHHPRARAR